MRRDFCNHQRRKAKREAFALRLEKDVSGSAAVEFAIIAPVFLLMALGMLGFGIYLGALHSVRQLTSDIARASISGVSEEERRMIATNFVANNIDNYAFVNAENLTVALSDNKEAANQSLVEVTYDASDLPVWGLAGFVPMPGKTIVVAAAITNGGYAQ
ncbi:TadE/TadG family type IV pilus assembly protein [Hyphococcus sp.]|uniref:TadE/TadG family type IV pilus assembly protein n=1 Tax=Hyphococcus sp. TaxID=2038636 RepID=UPI003CCBCEB7